MSQFLILIYSIRAFSFYCLGLSEIISIMTKKQGKKRRVAKLGIFKETFVILASQFN